MTDPPSDSPRRRVLAFALTASVMTASTLALTAATAPAAHAANKCHLARNTWRSDGIVKTNYPVRLHGTVVFLRSDGGNASTYAQAVLRGGDTLTIDRTSKTYRKGKYDREWRDDRIHPIGTWDYCGRTASGNHQRWVKTPRIDGSYRGVRACLRRGGVLECSHFWYIDFDS